MTTPGRHRLGIPNAIEVQANIRLAGARGAFSGRGFAALPFATLPAGLRERVPSKPDRPNTIGLHRVEIPAVDGLRILVSNLEALDATPILDLKPVLDPIAGR